MPFSSLIFDLDNTLTESKSPLSSDMAIILCSFLEKDTRIAVITGGKLERITAQVKDQLACDAMNGKLFALPTSGAALYRLENNEWVEVYKEVLSDAQKQEIFAAFERIIPKLSFALPEEVYGERIEDRGSQISFSAFGQDAPLEKKVGWDSDQKKRLEMRTLLMEEISGYTISIGGESSIDVTNDVVNKARGVELFLQETSTQSSEAIFFGDALFDGGNDASVATTGVQTVAVQGPEDTLQKLKTLLKD